MFEWDPRKAAANLAKHGIAFEDLPAVFEGPVWVAPDLARDYGEERWVAVGLLDGLQESQLP